METILIATDYSCASTNALNYAAALARRTGAKLAIIHAYSLSIPVAATAAAMYGVKLVMAEHQERLDKLAHAVAAAYGIETKAVSVKGAIEEVLDREVLRLDADLVVMGTKGGSLSRKLFGSATTYVMDHAFYPLLVVPAQAKFKQLARILLAYDAVSIGPYNTLTFLQELAAYFKAMVEVLHVAEDDAKAIVAEPEAAPLYINNLLREISHHYTEIKDQEALVGIQKGIELFQPDMVAMVPHRAGNWRAIFSSSKTRYISLTSDVPLLVLPNILQPGIFRQKENTGREKLMPVGS